MSGASSSLSEMTFVEAHWLNLLASQVRDFSCVSSFCTCFPLGKDSKHTKTSMEKIQNKTFTKKQGQWESSSDVRANSNYANCPPLYSLCFGVYIDYVNTDIE